MLTEPVITQLNHLHLYGMAHAFEQVCNQASFKELDFAEQLSQLIQAECTQRQSQRLAQRLRLARLSQQASLEDLDTRLPRGIHKATLASLRQLDWIGEHLNVLIVGPTGIGKSFIACALAHQACRADFSVRYLRMPRLVEELTRYGAQHKKSALFKSLAKVDLLALDDFGLAPLADETKRDLLEILDDRYDKKSTLVTSQLPVEKWYQYLAEPTLADAILDRLVHNSHRLSLKGESMRAKRGNHPTNVDNTMTEN